MADDKSYLPDPNAVVKTIPITPPVNEPAAAAHPFKILRTNELDPYETPKPPAEIEASPAAAGGDNFTGKDRKAAKISIASGAAEDFSDLGDLLDDLPDDADMIDHDPEITTGKDSDRVEEEEKNVRVKTWLYAASRESDNDFHVILGRDPAKTPRRYMNAEVSGLPTSGPNIAKLKKVRTSFRQIVQQVPGLGYDFYDPPIAVTVEGSIFFDMTHAHGSHPGPAKVKPKTIWEIHPITDMKPRNA